MSENWMLRNVLFVRKFVEKAHESSFPLGNEIQVAQPVHGGPRGTKWGLHNLYFDWASSSRATDNGGYIAVHVSESFKFSTRHITFAMCRAGTQLRHMAKYLCQPRGGLCTSQTCTRARLGETQNYGRYAEMHVHFFGTCTCCSTRDHRSGGFGTVVI